MNILKCYQIFAFHANHETYQKFYSDKNQLNEIFIFETKEKEKPLLSKLFKILINYY